MVTIPFLLVGIIMLFFILSFFYLSMTLAHVSVAQYLSYSAGRKLALANESRKAQIDASKDQYTQLRAKLFKSDAYSKETDWFTINIGEAKEGGGDAIGTNVGDDYPESNEVNKSRKRFYGIHLDFKAYKIKLNIPFISKENAKNEPIKARVTSFLGREPNKDECKDHYHKQRPGWIEKLCPDCSDIDIPMLIPDNGC